MADQVIGVTIRGIGDFSDVVSNVGSVQKALTKLKLPDKLGDSLTKNISSFMKEYDKYQKKLAEGINTQGNQNAINKSLNSMLNSYEKIVKDFGKLSSKDFKDLFNLDDSAFASAQKRIKDIQADIKKIKLDPKQIVDPINKINELTKAKSLFGSGKGFNKLKEAFDANDLEKAKEAIQEIDTYYERFSSKMNETKRLAFKDEFDKVKQQVVNADDAAKKFADSLSSAEKELADIGGKGLNEFDGVKKKLQETEHAAESVVEALKRQHSEEFNFNREAQNINRQIQSYFGLSQMIRKVGDIAKDAFSTVKELDAAMTETAVVTNFDVSDMWDMLPMYTAQANQLGSTIRDVYEAATLYFQQGLNINQSMGLANETLKMARIAGLGAAEATDMMTAALRGFNMEINQQSAQKINDIYSELAAITASDTAEIGSAMERTASIANSANMEFATTSAFLAQMIETTREAPENLGTAMKTIIARFQEMKQDPTKLIDSEGVAMDANKVDKALKTIGVNLMNTKGEFRDLDDVFLDIASRWDSLTQGQQRYIATIAAGSRQQSRFIAMMSDYERTMELVDAANNSAGASQRQFEKTLDSMEAKLNKLKNAWDQFTMGLMNNQILKFGVDALTEGFTVVNKFIDLLGKIPPKPFEGITKSALTLVTTLGMLQLGKKASRGLVMGGVGWWKGETSLTEGFKEGWASAGTTGFFTTRNNNAGQQGKRDGQAYGTGWIRAVQMLQTKQNTGEGILSQALGLKQLKVNKIQSIPIGPFIDQLLPENAITAEATKQLQASIDAAGGNVRQGLVNYKQQTGQGKFLDNNQAEKLQKSYDANKIKPLSTNFNVLTGTINSAGAALSNFGMILQGTPFESFGRVLTTVGSTLVSLSTILATTKAGFLEQWAAATLAGGAGEAQAMVALEEAAANGTLSVSAITAAGGMATLGTAIGAFLIPLAAIAVVIGAVVGAYKLLDAAIVTNKEKIEVAEDAAAAASEAYDSAKQETSELADSISQIQENEGAFDGLVIGTSAFNEQLVTANDQIMELIKKYPMLQDYLSTDKNGIMHISQEGLNAVKDYQKQIQANASALNILQTNDLRAEETRQEIESLRKKDSGASEYAVDKRQNQDEIKLLEKQVEAENRTAKINAVNTALVDEEISNRERVSAIMADQYDMRKSMVKLEGDKQDRRQQYADFYGYNYNRSTKKMTDVEGNEIDFDDEVIKDALKDITILADLEVDAKSLDHMLNNIDNKFSQSLGNTFEDSSHLFSDILSDNIDIDDDLLQNLITNPDRLQKAVNSLSEKEIAAVLGVSADAVAEAPDQYKNELTDRLTQKAANIAETQAQSYADLASMLAQVTSADIDKIINANGQFSTQAQVHNQQAIKEQLEKLTTEQKNTLSSIGSVLAENAGAETMRSFIKQATDIYTSGAKESIAALDNIIQTVNWSSPTARLKAYNDMLASSDTSVQKLGQDMRNSSESANLLGEAFEEFYDSSDFQELSENMDKFVDSSGKLNATSIQEMAEQCGSLNNLLDTGAISAGGVAAALNAMGSGGNLTILDLNENLLKFLSTANQLEDTLAEAHQLIENFDWGVDTGESEDFAKESTKKWKELYDNGEFGNQQLENYAKFVLGQERWNQELKDSGGNIETALNNMSKDILKYSNGFEQAWVDMANSSNAKYQDVHYGANGDLIWDTNGKTTDELVQWLADTRGITQEWAKLMVEDFANYSYDFKTELAANDFNTALEKGDYITSRQGGNDAVNVTRSEIQALAAAQNKTEAEIETSIAKAAGIEEQELNVLENVDKNGSALLDQTNITDLNKQYSQAELGSATDQSWLTQYQAQDRQGNVIEGSTELKSAINGAIADGFQAEQATEMARAEAVKAFEGAKVFYDGVELNKEDVADSQAFADKISEITDNSRWNAVGEAIAQGYISYIKGTENSTDSQEPTWKSVNQSKESSDRDFSVNTPTEDPKEQARQAAHEKFVSWLQGLAEGAKVTSDDPQMAAAEAARQRSYKIDLGFTEGITNGAKEVDTSGAESAGQDSARQISEAMIDGAESYTPPAPTAQPSNQNQSSPAATPQETTQELKVIYTGTITNPDELKSSIDTQINSIFASVAAQTREVEATGSITVNYKKGSQAKAEDKNAKVNYTKGSQAKAEDKNAKVNYTLGTQAAPVSPKVATVNYVLGTQENPKEKHVKVHYDEAARGKNNSIIHKSVPRFGSMAKGSRYGRVGPQGRGGLTLTGEKGFEIAWLPSESRSMILGADGPQMTMLPPDAVVYTHEQSKKIIKQKAIPAGSHAGRHLSTSGSGPSSKTSSSSSSNNNSKTEKAAEKLTSSAAMLSKTIVWWDNIARRAEAVQRKADKNQKSYEKYLKNIQATLKTTGTKGGGNAFIANTQNAIKIYQKELDRAAAELNNMNRGTAAQQAANVKAAKAKKTKTKKDDKKAKSAQKKATKQAYQNEQGGAVQISYSKGKGKKKKTVNKLVNTSKYIKAQDGTFVIDQKQLNKVKNKEERKALADALNKEINDRLSKKYAAKDNIQKAQEALEKFSEELYNTFFKWETELTKIWNITQKIEQTEGKISRMKGYQEILENQVATGMATADQVAGQMNRAFLIELYQQREQLKQQRELINQRKEAVKQAYSLADEQERLTKLYNKLSQPSKLSDTEKAGYEKYAKELEESVEIATAARKYITPILRSDGIIEIDFNNKLFEQDRLDVTFTEERGKAIQDYVKQITETSAQLNEDWVTLTNQVNELYSTLETLQDQWVDYAQELWDISEAETKKNSENAKKLSTSITNALKDLLDEVKKKLDERRKQEDNAKTERDISSKQQRLAMLRADTSGGHAVEIAQLEQEIADAQQNYQRSLEDQLLDRMQNQADEAARQRERQIELQLDTIAAINNAALVNKWMNDPEKYRDEIWKWYKEKYNYDSSPDAIQKSFDRKFESLMAGLKTNQKDQEETKAVIKEATEASNNTKDAINSLAGVVDDIEQSTEALVTDDLQAELERREAELKSTITIDDTELRGRAAEMAVLKEQERIAAEQAKFAAEEKKRQEEQEKLRQQQLAAEQAAQAQRLANQKANEINQAKQSYTSNKDHKTIASITGAQTTEGKTAEAYYNFLVARGNKYDSGSQYWGKIGKDGLQAQINRGQKIGRSEMQVLQDLADTKKLTWADVLKAYIKLKGQKTAGKNVKAYFANNLTDARKKGWETAFGKKYPNYLTGGLANFTGPAWLDGTPTKPELVLNAQDTKNFIALKDVLSHAMGSASNISSEYCGDATYEININVEKLTSDYDVDKVAERVKKIIVKDSSYRNVTQVRKFR